MNIFEIVKANVTARQAVESYGISVNRYGMCCCPFHNDKNPSMKVDKRYYCFACQETGDAVDFVSKYFGLSCKDAAAKICKDFGIAFVDDTKYPRNRTRAKKGLKSANTAQNRSPNTSNNELNERVFKKVQQQYVIVLCDYLRLLRRWKDEYKPATRNSEYHPYFIEALTQTDYIEYLVDTLLYGNAEDIAKIIIEEGDKINELKIRFKQINPGNNK